MSDTLELPFHPFTGLMALGMGRRGPIWPVLGGAEDGGDTGEGDGADDGADDSADDAADDTGSDDEELRPEGRKALEAEKEKRRKAAARAKAAEDQNAELRRQLAALSGTPAGNAANGGDDREARANAKILRAEVKSLAADLFEDASDAHLFIDLSKFEVDDDGDVIDPDAITAALKDVLKRKPHLARRKFRGSGDQNPRDGGAKTDPGPGLPRLMQAYAESSK